MFLEKSFAVRMEGRKHHNPKWLLFCCDCVNRLKDCTEGRSKEEKEKKEINLLLSTRDV